MQLMERKKSNLSVAADVDTAEEMLELADKVGGGLEGRGKEGSKGMARSLQGSVWLEMC